MTREILTLAMGRPLYVNLAINLARSFRVWNDESGIQFRIITDQQVSLPNSLSFVTVEKATIADLGEGFSSKLKLDRLVRSDQSLFIDADCLCVGPLGPVFDAFSGHPVGVVGRQVTGGEWFGNLDSILPSLGLRSVPKFNGGIYYIERGETASAVFETARLLEPRYDKLGLIRLRGRPNDELLISLALGANYIQAVPDDGQIMADPHAFPKKLKIDTLRGISYLINPDKRDAKHQAWNPLREAAPLIIHFLGDHHGRPEYRTEILAMRAFEAGAPRWLAWLAGRVTILWPGMVARCFKNSFRPFYHKIFGARSVRISDRI